MGSHRSTIGIGLAIAAAYAAILAAMGFHLCLNDFWAWSFFASRIELAQPATLHNGFMPPAYAVFLKLVGASREIAAAFALTLVSVFVVAVAAAVSARRRGPRRLAIVGGLLLATWPPFLESGLTAGPDIVVAALVSLAVAIHWSGSRSKAAALGTGLLLGIAVLVRTHALLAGLAILLAPAVVDRRVGAADFIAAAGLVAGVAVQVAVNLAAGEAAWSNAQAFNVYKMVHGMDWYHPVLPADLSVATLVREQPVAFLKGWAGALLREGIWLVGPAMAWLHARRHGLTELQRFSALAFLAGALYVLPVSLGDSPRAMVVIGLLVIVPVAALVTDLRRHRPSLLSLAMAVVVAAGVVLGLKADRAFLEHNFRQSRDFAAVESGLLEAGVSDARAVFTEDFDLYFRQIPGRRPLTLGGWGVIGIEGWTEEFPQLDASNLTGFLESCRGEGVRYLALTRRVRRLGPEFSTLYYDPAATGLAVLGEYGEFVLIEVP